MQDILTACLVDPTAPLEMAHLALQPVPVRDRDRYVEALLLLSHILCSVLCEQNPHPLSQVYSFVPIPGAQQHKRPRRRYEEIERMYKCGWQGCEKAYGTLNHLNAHVTMQSHGSKRTPEGTLSKDSHVSWFRETLERASASHVATLSPTPRLNALFGVRYKDSTSTARAR